VAFPFQVKMPGMIVDIIDVFEFDEAGKVVSMKAYWGPGNMRS
jgi:steroid delta-isomerase